MTFENSVESTPRKTASNAASACCRSESNVASHMTGPCPKNGGLDNHYAHPCGVRDSCTAARAFIIDAAFLKDRPNPVLVAAWAYEVKIIVVGWRVLWRVGKSTNFGLVQYVADKFGLPVLLHIHRFQKLRQLEFQFRVRDLRVRYLNQKIGDQGFDLSISSRLRRAGKTLEALGQINERISRLCASSYKVDEIAKQIGVHMEILSEIECGLMAMAIYLEISA